MRTNIDINDELLREAMTISHAKTKKAVIELALQQYVDRQARMNLLTLRGKVQWDGDLEQMRISAAPTD